MKAEEMDGEESSMNFKDIGTQRQAKYDLLHKIASGDGGEDHLLTHLSNFISDIRQIKDEDF